tara:strand:+ start:2777 stop:3565 length:789 start_codon:yes stop_codon:yes gene_type:complete
MGGMKGTNSRAGAGDRSNRKTTEGIKAVKKTIGFNQTKHPTEGIVDSYALKSKKGGKGMYGSEASDATNNYLVSIGEAKVGNYFKQVGGKHIRLSKLEGEKLYKSGDTSVSRSYMVSSKGKKIKYGKSGGAMGSGDNSGIMNSIPISEQMFESQKKLKTALVTGLSFAVPGIGGTIMRLAALKTYNSTYSGYKNKFNKNMSKSFTARNNKSNEQANNDSANLAFGDTNTTEVANKSKTSKKFKKYLAGTGSDESSNKRTFYN